MRLWLVGDDEVLDAVAEMSRHLEYFQVSRVDELPDQPLGSSDHVLIAMRDPASAGPILARANQAALVYVVPAADVSDGARAILAAAELVRVFIAASRKSID